MEIMGGLGSDKWKRQAELVLAFLRPSLLLCAQSPGTIPPYVQTAGVFAHVFLCVACCLFLVVLRRAIPGSK